MGMIEAFELKWATTGSSPVAYRMQWSTWLRVRRVLRTLGVSISYRTGQDGRRHRFIGDVPVFCDSSILPTAVHVDFYRSV